MTDRCDESLHTSGHRRGVAAAPHHAAAEAGRLILADGGNALEAMVAMAASIAAVYPHMNHVGGDGFWLVREPSGRVRALMAPGPAGARATVAFYREAAATTRSRRAGRSPRSRCRARSAAGCWRSSAPKALGGKMPLDLLLEPAIQQARDGYIVTRSQHALTRDKLPEMNDAPGFAQTFLIDGKVPADRHHDEADRARRDARSSRQCRARRFLSRRCRTRDRSRSRTHRLAGDARRSRKVSAPMSPSRSRSTLDIGTLYNAPPPTQGLASLIILALFERLRVAEAEGFDFVHGLVESTKRAFRVRDRVVTDPEPHRGAARSLSRRPRSSMPRCSRSTARKRRAGRAAMDEGDTIWMGAADASGSRRVLHPVDLLGIRLGLRAAAHRRPDA